MYIYIYKYVCIYIYMCVCVYKYINICICFTLFFYRTSHLPNQSLLQGSEISPTFWAASTKSHAELSTGYHPLMPWSGSTATSAPCPGSTAVEASLPKRKHGQVMKLMNCLYITLRLTYFSIFSDMSNMILQELANLHSGPSEWFPLYKTSFMDIYN